MRSAARVPGARRIPPLVARRRDDVVLFESWHGKVADSPRAISEEIRRRKLPVEQVWVAAPGAAAPPGVTTVRPDSATISSPNTGTSVSTPPTSARPP